MNSKPTLATFLAAVALAPSVFASFHLKQVEQVIGGVNGAPSAQAYSLGPVPATVIKNNGASLTLSSQPEIVVEQPLGNGLVDGSTRKRFGSILVGERKTKTFTIRNTGSAKLTGLKIRKTGANPNDFSLTSLGKTSLAPGERVKFKVTFKPSSNGTRRAAIHIKSNDADENPFDIKLTGIGVSSPYYP